MKRLLCGFALCAMLMACAESMEDKAERECQEFTRKFCPTPYVNNERTDSQVFYRDTKTVTYYRTLRGDADNQPAIEANKAKLHEVLREGLSRNTSLKLYKEAGFRVRFVYRSASDSTTVLYEDSFDLKGL